MPENAPNSLMLPILKVVHTMNYSTVEGIIKAAGD